MIKKRLLAVLTALALIITFMPSLAYADGGNNSGKPVKSIDYQVAGDGIVHINENDASSGEFERDGQGNLYFFYYFHPQDGDKMTLEYTDGTKAVYIFDSSSGEWGNFINQDDSSDTISQDEIDFQSDQYFNHWYPGSIYYINVGYRGVYTDQIVPIEIVPAYNDPGQGGDDEEWYATGNGEDRNGMYTVKMQDGQAHLEVSITGSNSAPLYRWEHEFHENGDGVIREIQGEAGPSIDVTETGWYACYVSNNGDNEREIDFMVYSDDPDPGQGGEGWSVTGNGERVNDTYQLELLNGQACLEVTVTGNVAPTYRWEHEYHKDGGTYTEELQGEYGPSIAATDLGWYSCYVTVGDDTSQIVFIVYTNDPGYGSDEWDVTGNGEYRNGAYYVKLVNGKANLQVILTGNNDMPTYTWQREIVSDEGTEYPYLDYATPSIAVTEPGWYACYVTNNGMQDREVDFIVYKEQVKKGSSVTSGSSTYKVTATASSGKAGTVTFTKAKNTKSVTVPETIKVDGKTYKVTTVSASAFKGSKIRTVTISKNVKTISANAFKSSKATKLIIKSKSLTKKSVKGSLKGSKITSIQVKAGSKSVNKKLIKKYKTYFTKANAGKKVTVK